MSFEDDIPEENKMRIEISTMKEIEEDMFLEEILEQYDKVYRKEHDGITVQKKLEYMSESGHIWSFLKQEKQLVEVVTPGDRKKDENSKFYYISDKKMIPTLLINLINKLEMHGQFKLK